MFIVKYMFKCICRIFKIHLLKKTIKFVLIRMRKFLCISQYKLTAL